jgi:hypothetical protein
MSAHCLGNCFLRLTGEVTVLAAAAAPTDATRAIALPGLVGT